ncbi:transposase, partial [Marinilabilia rubra]
WLIEKTDIQRASKVRSTKGLIVHAFGRLSAAFLNYAFNP